MKLSRWITLLMMLALWVGVAPLTGCRSTDKDEAGDHSVQDCDLQDCPIHPYKVAKDEPKAKKAEAPRPVGRHVMSFPSAIRGADGEDCCGRLTLERIAPAEVAVGQEYEYSIVVTNHGDLGVRDVVVTDAFPANWKLVSAEPAAADGKGVWNLGEFKPGESKTIKVKGSASAAGQVVHCASVTFNPFLCIATNVIQPALKLTKTAPAEVLICDPIPVKFVVTNSGTGTARAVRITDTLPEGLVTDAGANKVDVLVGDLATGQSREVNVVLKAAKAGAFKNTASANAEGGLKAEASAATTVREPVLAITKTGPAQAFIGKNVAYEIIVSNKGDVAAPGTVVTDTLGAGAAFVSATEGGTHAGGKVTWNLGALAAGASKTLSVVVKPDGRGDISNTAMASAKCAKAVNASAGSKIVGIPAILLEVVDAPDPVQVGTDTVYDITVTNQGSADGKNIKIVAKLEKQMAFVAASGPTTGAHADGTITFQPLANLAPKAKATWRVTIKASDVGDVRFSVSMTEERLTRPVEETEATNLYK